MFIAHIPFAYATTKLFLSQFSSWSRTEQKRLLLWGMGSGILPDIDVLFYFGEESGKRVHHHDYFPHWPSTWITVALITYMLSFFFPKQRRTIRIFGGVLAFQGLCHIVWDFASSPIKWFAPFSPTSYTEIFKVTQCSVEENWCRILPIWESLLGFPCQQHGPLSYVRDMICYKTFLLELIICGLSLVVWIKYRRLDKSLPTV